ncbi:MAG: carbon-phosphorus lyase complex subunit PhnI, partial [Hydrogenovibrio crunogenus]|nr:carbon-phosphorus lyase complex subunit PhnI [Hydrogenovibrio crunogenus]
MGYVAIKGGGQAIAGAEKLLEFIRTRQGESAEPLDLDTIENQLYFLHSRILSEGGLFHPKLASLAIKQSLGDTLEAAFALRAYRSTKPRLIETPVLDTTNMRVIRRISASFKDIPGGQMLGASTDYALRLMRTELLNESREDFQAVAAKWLDENHYDDIPDTFPKVLDALREEWLLPPVVDSMNKNNTFDI